LLFNGQIFIDKVKVPDHLKFFQGRLTIVEILLYA